MLTNRIDLLLNNENCIAFTEVYITHIMRYNDLTRMLIIQNIMHLFFQPSYATSNFNYIFTMCRTNSLAFMNYC